MVQDVNDEEGGIVSREEWWWSGGAVRGGLQYGYSYGYGCQRERAGLASSMLLSPRLAASGCALLCCAVLA